MANIDNLEIKIGAQAKTASNAIDNLCNKLGRLSASLGAVNTGSITGMANGVNRLASAMTNMKSVGTADFTRAAKGIEKMASIDTASLNRAASSLGQIGKSLNGLSGMSAASRNLADLSKGIAQLGYKSSTQAIQNIPKLATAMKQLMSELSTAPRVSQNLIDMTNALAKLSRTGASAGKAANSLKSSLISYSGSAKGSKLSTFSLAASIGKLYASYWMLIRAAGKLKDAVNLASDLTEVQNVVDTTFGAMTGKVEEYAKKSIETLGMSELSFKTYASQFQAMGSAMGIGTSQIAKANDFLQKTTNGYVGASDSLADVSLNLTLSPYMAVYLQGVLDGSRFKPVSKQPLVQTVPTTMDGYYYMLVGIAYASDTIMLQAEHPIYRNLGGKFQKMGATADETILQWCKNNDLTYIDGGKIYAKSVTSQEIDTEELFAQKISATNMSITGESQVAGFHISGNQLYTLNGTRGELYFGESDDNLNLIEIKEFISGSGYDTYFSVDNVGQVSCNELTVQNGGNANIGGKITADSIVSAKVMTANDRQKDNYEWKNVDTVNNSLTAALVVDPYTAEVHMRNLPKGEFDLENSNGWYRYGKRTFIKLNGEFVGAVESCPYPPQGNTVYQWVMLLNVSEGTWWPGFMEITMDGSVSFRTVTALGVTELFECTGTGFRVYGYIDFFNG